VVTRLLGEELTSSPFGLASSPQLVSVVNQPYKPVAPNYGCGLLVGVALLFGVAGELAITLEQGEQCSVQRRTPVSQQAESGWFRHHVILGYFFSCSAGVMFPKTTSTCSLVVLSTAPALASPKVNPLDTHRHGVRGSGRA
jgi:hypothetical protein